ncbi:MAG: universal stress protein [Zetaproteobacteria bacterium]|nr:MAG: universal stress protein [Zetaproteobacteria bacterium]
MIGQRILVPTDFSDASTEALREACRLAKAAGGKVHVLHVLDPGVFFDTDLVQLTPLDDVATAMRKVAQKRMREQVASLNMEVSTHIEEAIGDPSRAICTFAEGLPADLIVIGRHGMQGALEHFLIGSTAERVVRHATCSVLVIMPRHDEARART